MRARPPSPLTPPPRGGDTVKETRQRGFRCRRHRRHPGWWLSHLAGARAPRRRRAAGVRGRARASREPAAVPGEGTRRAATGSHRHGPAEGPGRGVPIIGEHGGDGRNDGVTLSTGTGDGVRAPLVTHRDTKRFAGVRNRPRTVPGGGRLRRGAPARRTPTTIRASGETPRECTPLQAHRPAGVSAISPCRWARAGWP